MTTDGAHDFDFLHGDWQVTHERLRERLTGCSDWDVTSGSGTCRPILDGCGNYEELRMPELGTTGMSLRLYDPATDLWAIHWASTLNPRLDPPQVGRFVDGVGVFDGQDEMDGRAVTVRFVWDETTATSARWQQFFSVDDGATWEKNWVMQFRREPSEVS